MGTLQNMKGLGLSTLLVLVLAGCGDDETTMIGGPAGGAGAVGGGAGTGGTGADGGTGTTGGTGGTGGTAGSGGEAGGATGYHIAGTVAGLEGLGLVVQNNGTDDLPIDQDGAFQFATPLADGAGYDVTVHAEPTDPSQSCSVTGGVGTVQAADVSDVAIACTTNSFSVGGTVTGLYAGGLVLQNNGGDDLLIDQNGVFAFPTELLSGASYDVTVQTLPFPPEHECEVVGSTGMVGAVPVSTVQVQCGLFDTDDDGVPDLADPFPQDGTKPVPAQKNTVYAHTSSQLFTMNVNNYAIANVGPFHGSGYSGSMTDVAVDQFGVLYGVTFNDLFVCDASTAECYHLASLPQSFNGLTMVPPGTHDPLLDTLIAISTGGQWYRIDLIGPGQAQLTSIGQYGSGYSSSGDAFSIENVGTYAAVDKSGESYDVIVSVDPMTGAVLSEVGPVPGYSSLYGLAGWTGEVYGFDASGAVILIDLNTSQATVIAQTSNSWWGAGVSTRLD